MRKHGCDMRGFLSFQVLFLVAKRPMHGNEIANEMEKRRGEKPKAGTIYPALKDLSSIGFIKGRKNGKIIVYSITPTGKTALKRAMTYFVRCFGEIMAE